MKSWSKPFSTLVDQQRIERRLAICAVCGLRGALDTYQGKPIHTACLREVEDAPAQDS